MRINFLFICAIVVLDVFILSCTTAEKNPTYSSDIEEKIRQVENNLGGWVQISDSGNAWNLKQRMDYYKARGLSIAVIHNYKLEWARGYGLADTASGQPVTVKTLFQAGSISKSLNGVGVLKLVQDKKLDLYTDINNYLRSWKFPYDSVSKGKKITLAYLLSHTAGLTIHGFPGYERGDTIPNLQEILDGKAPANTKAVRSQFEPGLRYQYSGGGTTISQLIISDITQQPYDEYMWKNVLKPMQMMMSSYTQPPAADKQKFLATGYRANGKEVEKKYHIYPEQAAAGLWTNPTDLANYIIETQLSLQGKSDKVLTKQMTELRLKPYVDSFAALGVFINKNGDEKYFGHNGADEGFLSAYKGSLENGNGVVVMVNSDNGRILDEVINSVAKVYNWKNYYTPVMKKTMELPDSLLELYSGNYMLEEDSIKITRSGQQLVLTINNNESHELYFSSADEFFTLQIPLEFKFGKDGKGKITGFSFNQRGQNILVKRL